jgi:molybdenum cofactor guanylyltransferase
VIPRAAITLGILAGGRGQRMGGQDKAWVRHRGAHQIENILDVFSAGLAERLVSARAPDPRFGPLGLRVVLDRREDFPGPLAGFEALCAACSSPWLLTTPVDVDGLPRDLIDRLIAAAEIDGASLRDRDGLQPLIGLWRVAALSAATTAALDRNEPAAHRVVSSLRTGQVDLSPQRIANLNTPNDLSDE